ncbi:MAG: ACT domain-containing protein [Actinomycetota bacterium]|nr:ACT domain-containing protein [Actinomycetota bacterium]
MGCYRVRIELPDRPGALAKAAAAMAAGGGNVLSVDIHEIDGERTIDEILVELPEGSEPAVLATALAEADAGTMLSVKADSAVVDPIVRALHWVGFALVADPQDCDLALAQSLSEICTSAIAWVATPAEAELLLAGRQALELGSAVVTREAELPSEVAAGLPGPVWVMAVPDDHMSPSRVGFAARAATLRFTASEVARAEALMGVCYRLNAPSRREAGITTI